MEYSKTRAMVWCVFSFGFPGEFGSPCEHRDRTGHGADEREIRARGPGLEDPTGD